MQMAQPGLYIHVPFCEKKCAYCNFYSVTSLDDIPEYVNAALKELSLYKGDFSFFDTIYFGGGTPSLLSSAALSDILIHVRNTFTIADDAEITVEINPGDADLHFLFDEDILRFLDRRHTCEQAIHSIEQARATGFDNIGLDLIYGIPDQSLSSWRDALSQALSFHPEHLSCYQLSLEDETPLGRKHQNNEFALPGEDEQAELFMLTSDILTGAGYLHYEVSNFACGDGFKSRHNQKYWRHDPYLGIGPAAHSFSGQRRWWNHRSVKQYLLDLREDRGPLEASETLTLSQLSLEASFLGLRTGEGIPLQHFSEQHENMSPREREKLLDLLVQQGLIVVRDGFLKPTLRGMAVADRLALML
jgi:oxygen-independent coproporphyrinogen-3 oxidase